jgi:hypothetical protein
MRYAQADVVVGAVICKATLMDHFLLMDFITVIRTATILLHLHHLDLIGTSATICSLEDQ